MTRTKNWPKILFGLILIFAAQLACDVSGQNPKDEKLQDPAVNLMANFNRLLKDIGFAGSSDAPWIVQILPKAENEPEKYVLMGKAFFNGHIGIYSMQPQGCGQPFKAAALLAKVPTENVSPGFDWQVDPIQVPTGTVIGALEIRDAESAAPIYTAFSSLRLVGTNQDWEMRLSPPANQLVKTSYTTLYGRAQPGLCVELWKGSQKLAQASAAADGILTFVDIKMENGSASYFLQAVGLEVADATPLRSAEVKIDVYQTPQPYDPSQRPDLSGDATMKHIYGQVDAPIKNTPDTRSPEAYIAVIEQFDPGSKKYKRYGDGTNSACNIFAGDVMRAMGTPLPTKKDLGNVDGGGNLTAGPARLLKSWFNHQRGKDAGWVKIDKNNNDDLRKLLQNLREGRPAVAIDSGHIAVLRPDGLPDTLNTSNIGDLYIAQAGGSNGEHNLNKVQLKNAGYMVKRKDGSIIFAAEFYIHP